MTGTFTNKDNLYSSERNPNNEEIWLRDMEYLYHRSFNELEVVFR